MLGSVLLKGRGEQREILFITWKADQDLSEVSEGPDRLTKKISAVKEYAESQKLHD